MKSNAIINEEWKFVLQFLPRNLEETAQEKLAIRRRRGVESAESLLRLALAYSVCDYSLRQTAAWAKVAGVAELSDVALLKRLRGASEWLGSLVVGWLLERGLASRVPSLPIRLVDATVVAAPGATGAEWRVHLGLDLDARTITSLELTGPEGGETLLRHSVAAGEVVIGDRGYASREGIASVLDSGGHILVRCNWQNLPMETSHGKPVDVVALLETLGPAEIGDWDVSIRVKGRTFPLRLVAVRKTLVATERERTRARAEASRKQRRIDPRTLRAAAFQFVLTDLERDVLPAVEALELYRLRWQIEIAFKRLKSILKLDNLRAHDPKLAQTYLYAKLLGALILDELCNSALAFFPSGFPLVPQARQSLALADLLD